MLISFFPTCAALPASFININRLHMAALIRVTVMLTISLKSLAVFNRITGEQLS